MENLSAVTFFILTAYKELDDHRYLYFMCFLLTYIVILLVNSVLIVVICTERDLHGPMYLFICSLMVNGLYGSTSLLPSILGHLLSHSYKISLSFCMLQIYCVASYAFIEFTVLAVMSYDRYVAICHPLHYHVLMSPRKVSAATVLSWVVPCLFFALYFIPTLQLSFCERHIEKVYCINFAVINLSCFDMDIQRLAIIGLALILICPSPQIVMILFSYAQILTICLSTKESQSKAIQTCIPHVLSVINYSMGIFFEIVQACFNMSHVPYKFRIFLSLYFLIIPPLLNPVIYGISIKSIKAHFIKLLSYKKNDENK